jgi:SpoVK/Ycf46/Vps4 family AAA+-type ATPase
VLFSDAIKARLPLVTVTTRDLMNFKEVVEFVTQKKPSIYNPDVVKEGTLYYYADDKPIQHPNKVYEKFANSKATLIVVNPVKHLHEAFDAGELFVPIEMVRKTLLDVYGTESAMKAFVETLLPTLGGLTLKEIGEVIRLAEVKFDEVSPAAITRTRAMLVPDMQGFSAVSTTMDGPYLPNEELLEFADDNKELFLDPTTDPRLVPKGLLGDGMPGTGKTSGAKWLADRWGVPLYRLDASVLNKYYGESENNLKAIFGKVAHEAPCILMIDEAEKLIGIGDHGHDNMMDRIRSMLLWQMQEGREHVFYLLTTNDKSKLPPELIREGRIDKSIFFEGLEKKEAYDFAEVILQSFTPIKPSHVAIKHLQGLVDTLLAGSENGRVAHSKVTEAVKNTVKWTMKGGSA